MVYGAGEAADTALRETAKAAQREGRRLSVVALAPVEPEHARCCGVGSVYWNRLQRELAESELARARLVVEDDGVVDLNVLGHGGLGAADAIAAWATDLGADRILLAHPHAAGLGRWARRRLRRLSPLPVSG